MTEPAHIDYAVPTKPRRHSISTMTAVSFGMAFLFAITFVVVLTLTLPKSDGAYGQMPFQDPLVFPVMSVGASFAGLLVALPFCFTCRSLRLGRSVGIIIGITMIELLIVTPIDARMGFLGSFVAFAVGLVAARAFAGSPRSGAGSP